MAMTAIVLSGWQTGEEMIAESNELRCVHLLTLVCLWLQLFTVWAMWSTCTSSQWATSASCLVCSPKSFATMGNFWHWSRYLCTLRWIILADLQFVFILGLNFLWSGRGGSLKVFQVWLEADFRLQWCGGCLLYYAIILFFCSALYFSRNDWCLAPFYFCIYVCFCLALFPSHQFSWILDHTLPLHCRVHACKYFSYFKNTVNELCGQVAFMMGGSFTNGVMLVLF